MNKKINILGMLLVAQLALVYVTGFEKKSNISLGKFITQDITTGDKIVIEVDQKKLSLEKKAGNWVISDKQDFPADEVKLKTLIQEFSNVNKTDLVGSSAETQKTLKVLDNDFMRKVDFLKGNQPVAEVIFGNSSSFKRIYSRLKGTNEIYELPINEYQLSIDPMDWVKRDILKISGEIKAFTLNDISLRNENGQWLGDKVLPENISQEETAKIISRLTNLGYDHVMFDLKPEEFTKISKFLEFTIDNGQPITFTFAGPYQTEYLLLKVSDKPFYFKVLKSKVDGLKAFILANLLKK